MTLDREEKRRLMERKLAEAKHKEKRKLIVSAVGIALCFAIIFVVQDRVGKSAEAPEKTWTQETDYGYLLQKIDPEILKLIDDSSSAACNVIESEAFESFKNAAKPLVGSWLYYLGEPEFPFEGGLERSNEARGKPFRMRGKILDRREIGAGAEKEIWWILETAEGYKFRFVDISGSDSIELSENFSLADGYFFKYYEETFGEESLLTPLFVGRGLKPSFAPALPITEPSPDFLIDVRDHPIGTDNNPTKLDRDPYLWHLLNVARTVGHDEELHAKAIEDSIVLDEETLKALVQNPAIFRGRMFELGGMVREASKNQLGENPLREKNISSAWIRNDLVGTNLTHLKAPGVFDFGESKGPIIYHGYFLMLWAYVDTEGNRLRTPVFVVIDAATQEKITPPFAGQIIIMFLAIAIVIGILLFLLIKRDKKASDLALAKVAERRAARRNDS
ncbi:MAG: hypothetical protein O3A95_03100 [Planctomycetota bacterium]|nr:hypothetical protein [Planctomycetota bacterium]MDA1113268.1 hypothetical protein [Planctomycetota bacterium]